MGSEQPLQVMHPEGVTELTMSYESRKLVDTRGHIEDILAERMDTEYEWLGESKWTVPDFDTGKNLPVERLITYRTGDRYEDGPYLDIAVTEVSIMITMVTGDPRNPVAIGGTPMLMLVNPSVVSIGRILREAVSTFFAVGHI